MLITINSPINRNGVLERIFVAGLLAVVTASAKADYTVINDDLLPTSVVEARYIQPPKFFTVGFVKNRSTLTNTGRNTINSLLPLMLDASVKIIGRPDATAARGKTAMIPENRARNIKDFLTRQGVPANSITIEIDNSPNPQESGIIYPSDIVITRADRRQVVASAYTQQQYTPPPQRQMLASYAQAAQQQPVLQQNPSTASQQDALIQFINQGVKTGQMEPAVALQLMRALLGDASKDQQQFPALASNLPASQAPMIIQKQDWILDKNMTLRDNINAWLKIANWNPSLWEASNFYQISTTSTVNGNFPDVLRQIADSTGLNICVNGNKKTVRVTDSTASCK